MARFVRTAEIESYEERVKSNVHKSLHSATVGKVLPALDDIVRAIEWTAKRRFPSEKLTGKRYIEFLREKIDIIQHMMGGGIDLEKTKFGIIRTDSGKVISPDFAELIYHSIRCKIIHEGRIGNNIEITHTDDKNSALWIFGMGKTQIPDRLIYALIGTVVFSVENKDIKDESSADLSLRDQIFPLREWWGKEVEFKKIISNMELIKVEMKDLD